MRKRWLGVVAGLMVAFGSVLVVAPAAHAVTGTSCTGTGCDGLDPTVSFNPSKGECSAGARNVDDLPNGERAFGGLLELRFGPNCTTNWTRFTPADNGTYEIWVTRLSDGVFAGTGKGNFYVFSGANGVGHFSDQVYSPGPAQACVFSDSFGTAICFNQTA